MDKWSHQYSNGRKCPECEQPLAEGLGCHACWFCEQCGIGGCDNYLSGSASGKITFEWNVETGYITAVELGEIEKGEDNE